MGKYIDVVCNCDGCIIDLRCLFFVIGVVFIVGMFFF